MHTHFLTLLLEKKRASSSDGQNNNSFLICSIGDALVNQVSKKEKKKKSGCWHENTICIVFNITLVMNLDIKVSRVYEIVGLPDLLEGR